jgi:formylglycine-generating enzyme required for sulfatase activity
VREVHIKRPFTVSRYEITFDQYDEFAKATKRELPEDEGFGRGRLPVIFVSWDDAVAHADWLS